MGLVKAICEKLGKANLPVYTVAAVAVFKGILRPTFTMMDKKQDPETKKYAAIREGATELIAIPTYIGLTWLTQKFAPAFSPKGKSAEQLLHSTKSTLGFFGVCFAALFAIPKLCNIAMPHVMKALKMEKPKEKKEESINALSQERWDAVQNIKAGKAITTVQSPYSRTTTNTSGGMRV